MGLPIQALVTLQPLNCSKTPALMLTVVLAPRLVTTSPFRLVVLLWASLLLRVRCSGQRAALPTEAHQPVLLVGQLLQVPSQSSARIALPRVLLLQKLVLQLVVLSLLQRASMLCLAAQTSRAGRGPSATCSLVLQSLALLVLAHQILCNHGKVALRAAVGLSSRPHAAPQEQGPFHFLEFPPSFRFLAGGMPMTQQVFRLVEQAGQCDIEPV